MRGGGGTAESLWLTPFILSSMQEFSEVECFLIVNRWKETWEAPGVEAKDEACFIQEQIVQT